MSGFNIILILSIIIFVALFIFIILFMFSLKLRGKMMSNQFKSLKYMTDYSKDDIESALTNLSEILINTKNKVLNNNEYKLYV